MSIPGLSHKVLKLLEVSFRSTFCNSEDRGFSFHLFSVSQTSYKDIKNFQVASNRFTNVFDSHFNLLLLL